MQQLNSKLRKIEVTEVSLWSDFFIILSMYVCTHVMS